MIFPPIFVYTPRIRQLLYELDVLKAGYEMHPMPPAQLVNLRRLSLLKSSLFSARIEGNPLDLSDITDGGRMGSGQHTREISNLLSAYEQISEIVGSEVTIDGIKKLHKEVFHTLSSDAGLLRQEESAIYNAAGVAVYLTPAPAQIHELLDALCKYANTTRDVSPIVAGVGHIWFEKIHPFLDGNGRVGRLLSAYILKKSAYDFGGLVPLEQYLDEHRDEYYHFLGRDTQDVTDFLEFYLTALIEQAKTSLKATRELPKQDAYAHLLPRRAEIMRLIEDHKIISFDFLARRFRAIPTRTLHNDLSQLVKDGLVQKMGTTRGVSYTKK